MLDESPLVYLDYAATAPLCHEASEAMRPFLDMRADGRCSSHSSMNPNSLHTPGRNAFRALEDARGMLAKSIGADRPSAVIFTSGATESDNMAVKGISAAAWDARNGKSRPLASARAAGSSGQSPKNGTRDPRPHIVTSAIEHDAVLESALAMRRDGFIVDIMQPDRDGFVEVRELERILSQIDADGDFASLVSVQTANSEIGSIQPVAQLADCAHSHGAYFHTDATQALGKIAVDVTEWKVDAASFSSHKASGPRGIGALYLKRGVPMRPLISGGGQESALRSGTQDVCSAAGFASAAAAAVACMDSESTRLMSFRDELYEQLGMLDGVEPAVQVDEGSLDYLPNIVNVLFPGLESNVLLGRLDSLGIAVSGGSACSSNSNDTSHVLKALGIPDDKALGEIRISFGRFTDRGDIDALLHAVPKVLDWTNEKQERRLHG